MRRKVQAVYVTRPTFSPNVYQQMIGRGLRGPLNGGSEEVLIVNVEDNFQQFGGNLAFREFEHLWNPDADSARGMSRVDPFTLDASQQLVASATPDTRQIVLAPREAGRPRLSPLFSSTFQPKAWTRSARSWRSASPELLSARSSAGSNRAPDHHGR